MCVAMCGNVLQCVALCCNVLQCVAMCCNVLQCVAMCCNVLQRVAMCCNVLQCVAMCCNVLQCVAALTMNVSRRITRMTRRVPRGMCHSLYRNESVHLEVCCSVLQPYATTLPMKRFWSLGT